MVLLKQVSGSVLWKSCHKKFPKINSKTPVLKYLFKKFANLRSAALLKRDSSTSFFSRILRDFWNTYFVFDYRVLCKKVVLKSSTLFTAKFMWTAASGISENIVTRNSDYGDFLVTMVRIGLVWPAANLLMFCRIDCTSVFKVLSLFTEMQSSTDLALMSTQSMQ